MHKFPGICLSADANPGKPQLGDRLMKLCDQSMPQMRSLSNEVGRIAQHVRKEEGRKEGKKERTGWESRPLPAIATILTLSDLNSFKEIKKET